MFGVGLASFGGDCGVVHNTAGSWGERDVVDVFGDDTLMVSTVAGGGGF